MSEVDRSQDPGIVGPNLTTYRPVMLILLGLLSAILWAFAAWTAYLPTGLWHGHITAPHASRLVADFGMRIDPVSRALLEHAGLFLPLSAGVGLALAWWMRSRWALGFVLIALPLMMGAAQCGIGVLYTRELLDAISR